MRQRESCTIRRMASAARCLHFSLTGTMHSTLNDFCIHLWTRGAPPFDAAGKPQIATPAGHAALYFLRTLARDQAAVAPNLHALDSVKSG